MSRSDRRTPCRDRPPSPPTRRVRANKHQGRGAERSPTPAPSWRAADPGGHISGRRGFSPPSNGLTFRVARSSRWMPGPVGPTLAEDQRPPVRKPARIPEVGTASRAREDLGRPRRRRRRAGRLRPRRPGRRPTNAMLLSIRRPGGQEGMASEDSSAASARCRLAGPATARPRGRSPRRATLRPVTRWTMPTDSPPRTRSNRRVRRSKRWSSPRAIVAVGEQAAAVGSHADPVKLTGPLVSWTGRLRVHGSHSSLVDRLDV